MYGFISFVPIAFIGCIIGSIYGLSDRAFVALMLFPMIVLGSIAIMFIAAQEFVDPN